jgi:adenine-specific DNA-methyltransferase
VPVLPSPRYLETDEILADEEGIPLLKTREFLLNCDLPEDYVMREFPSLWRYLQKGKEEGIHERYLCVHRPIWYTQDKREPAPFLCTYMGRQSNGHNPFRFILNHSRAVAPNVCLNIYPKPALAILLAQKSEFKQVIWNTLRAIPAERLLGEGRVYGGGLYKIEPKELSNLRVDDLFDAEILPPVQQRLF